VKLVKEMYIEVREEERGRGESKNRWTDVIESDMKRAGVSIEDAGDRVK